MMTAIIATVVAAFVAVFATFGFLESLSYGDDDEEVLNQLFYMLQVIICSLEIIGALGQAAICCCATCCLDCKCRRLATEITVIYATCPTSGSGSLDDVKKTEIIDMKEKEMKEFGKIMDMDDKNNKDEGIENDGSTSGCDTVMDDDDVLMSNEELNEFWVIPRIVRGGPSAQRSRSDSTSSKKRERRPSSNSNSSKHRHFSDSSDKRERNSSGNSAKSEKRRHSSSSRYDKKERHDSGFPDTPVDNIAPNFDRATILDPMVLVNYGSGDTIVRSERSSETNSVAGSNNLKKSVPSAQTCNEDFSNTAHQSRSNSQDDSVFVDMEYLPQSSTAANASFTNSCSCIGDSQNDKLGTSRDDSQDVLITENALRRVRAEENLQCDTSLRNCPGTSRQDSNMSNASDCPSGHSLQSSNLPMSEEDMCTSESSGIKSMSRESSIENT
jgi:hypothetical protein